MLVDPIRKYLRTIVQAVYRRKLDAIELRREDHLTSYFGSIECVGRFLRSPRYCTRMVSGLMSSKMLVLKFKGGELRL